MGKRRTYETQSDLKREEEVAEILAEQWGVVAKKLPRFYHFDYALCDYIPDVNYNEQWPIKAMVEIKNRTVVSHRYDTVIIGLDKLMEADKVARVSDCMILLVYRFTDRICYYQIGQEKLDLTMGGRRDRNDKEDHNPVVHIPIEKFKIL